MSDHEDIQIVVDTFFAAFASGAGLDERMTALRDLFVEGAVISNLVGGSPHVMDVEGFVRPRHELLSGSVVSGFREWEVSGRTETFRSIAQHWCTYSKSWTEGGREHHGHGAKTLQFVLTAVGWRITALAWDDNPS